MGDDGLVQDLEIEWRDFLVKFHENTESVTQKIRKVNYYLLFYTSVYHLFRFHRLIFSLKKTKFVLFFIILFHLMNVNF